MRIAIFSETYLPDLNGVATHIKTLKDGLEALGHEVLIIKADASSKKHYIEEDVMHCPAIISKKIYNYSLSSPLSLKRLLMLKKWNPDIIHIQNEFGIGLSGALIAKMLKKPLVYTLHT
ncbi:MAG: glycosyltransferase, partial [Oscillospiraceae bacterium]